MSVSADTLRIAIVREATPGVIPATPVFQILRVTSESIAFTPETALSNELNPSRQLSDVIVAGGSSGGEIGFELSSSLGFELLLEGVMGNVWAGDELTVADMLLTHTVENRFTIDSSAAIPAEQYDYHRVVRALIDSMTITMAPGGAVTGSVSILGGDYTRDDAEIAGATYTASNMHPVMTGAAVTPIEFVVEGVTYEGLCLSNLVVNFRNNGRAIICLGSESANEVSLGRFEAEITVDVYVQNATKQLFDAFLEKQEIAVNFTVSDSVGNSYAFEFPRVRTQSATQPASGTNQDVILSLTLQALVDTLVGAADADSCVLITRTHTSTPWLFEPTEVATA